MWADMVSGLNESLVKKRARRQMRKAWARRERMAEGWERNGNTAAGVGGDMNKDLQKGPMNFHTPTLSGYGIPEVLYRILSPDRSSTVVDAMNSTHPTENL